MMNAAESSDHDLIGALRRGDEAAWSEFFHRYQGRIYRFAMQMSGSTTIAEDVTQEAFIAFLGQVDRYLPRLGPPEAYLLGIARNRVRKALAKAARNTELCEMAHPADVVANTERLDESARVRQAILELPEAFRETVVLCELEELSYEEAARLLGCPVGTVRSRLHRARQLLADALAGRAVTR